MSAYSEVLLNLIKTKIAKQRKTNTIVAVVLAVVCLGFLSLGFIFPETHRQSDVIAKYSVMGVSFVLLLSCLYWIKWIQGYYDPENSLLSEMIETNNKAGNIVWIYPYKLVYNGVPSYALIFKTNKGKEYNLGVDREEQNKILTMLQLSITNVTYGYSEALKKQFKKNPESLLKSSI